MCGANDERIEALDMLLRAQSQPSHSPADLDERPASVLLSADAPCLCIAVDERSE